jgi:hypothetical protein
MLTSKQGVELRQQAEITAALRCYAAATPGRRQAARDQAEQWGLLAPAAGAEGARMTVAAGGEFKTAAYALADEDSRYAMRLLLGTVPPIPKRKAEAAPEKTQQPELHAALKGREEFFFPLSEEDLDAAINRPKGEGAGPLPLGTDPTKSAASREPRKPDAPLAVAASLREHLLRTHRAYVCAPPDENAK